MSAISTSADVDRWILKAAQALATGSGVEHGAYYFYRDSEPERSDYASVHPTSSCRALVAIQEFGSWLDEVKGRRAAQQTLHHGLVRDADRVRRKLGEVDVSKLIDNDLRKRNPFKLSQFLLMRANELGALDGAEEYLNELTDLLQPDHRDHASRGGRIGDTDDPHDFITFYALRALDACNAPDLDGVGRKLARGSYARIVEQVAFWYSRAWSKFDPSQLAFGVAILDRFNPDGNEPLIACAIDILRESQGQDGAWSQSRHLSYQSKSLLYVASYELSYALAVVLQRRLEQGDASLADAILPILERAHDLVRISYTATDKLTATGKSHTMRGWHNDHASKSPIVETWVTAGVLGFLIRFRECLRLRAQHEFLASVVVRPPDSPPSVGWVDLSLLVERRREPDLDALERICDPSEDQQLISCLQTEVVSKIIEADSPRCAADAVSSLILHGPAGTRKTSLARSIANALRWPMVMLSPGDFLREGGIDGIERRTVELFDGLLNLRRHVVLFDELDQLVVKREKTETNTRTSAAFTTASLLPRLQDLRDTGWVVFFLATNAELGDLDPAITRQGRFDREMWMSRPVYEAVNAYFGRQPEIAGNQEAKAKALASFYEKLAKDAGEEMSPGDDWPTFSAIDQYAAAPLDSEEDAHKWLMQHASSATAPPLVDAWKKRSASGGYGR